MSVKGLVYGSLRGFGMTALARRRNRAVIFCFHNVVSDADAGRGEASLHLPLSRFRAIIDWMSHAYRIAPLDEIGRRLVDGRSLAGIAALTFDDAYLGVLRHALPYLAERGLPSSLFVVPEMADRPRPFWWDVLAERRELTDARRQECLVTLAGDHERILPQGVGLAALGAGPDRGAAGHDVTSPPAEDSAYGGDPARDMHPGRWDDILAARGPVTIGSHSLRHRNLTRLSDADLLDDLVASRQRIAERTGVEPGLVSYPYGLFDERVVRAAAEAGYDVGTRLSYGLVRAGAPRLALLRVNVPAGVDVSALESWAVGWRLRKPA